MVRPRKLLFLAIGESIYDTRLVFFLFSSLFNFLFCFVDGVAPRAKMNQQRSRRFRAAKDAAEAVCSHLSLSVGCLPSSFMLTCLFLRLLKKSDCVKSLRVKARGCLLNWTLKFLTLMLSLLEPSSCLLFPLPCNTTFTLDLTLTLAGKILRWYRCFSFSLCLFCSRFDLAFLLLKVILSDANVPGEGEHKIMSYIRLQKNHPGYNPNACHCLYGLVCNLLLLFIFFMFRFGIFIELFI